MTPVTDKTPADPPEADSDDVRIVEPDSDTEDAPEVMEPEPRPSSPPEAEDIRVVEDEEVEVVESEAEKQARRKEEEKPPRPKSNLGVMMVFMVVLFIMFDPNLRDATGRYTGMVLMPIIGFDGRFPVLTVVLAGVIMITLSTIVRHFFIDWISMARTQKIMRAFQKEFREARMAQDTKRVNMLAKEQQKLMGMQTEMTSGQMKPMGYTMLVVIPMFAWLWTFVSTLDYHWFSTPWNLEVDMYTREGIVFGTSVLPHWILLYSVLSIPFGQLLQKALKVWSWRDRVDHVLSDHPDVHDADE